ncbi:hypothetical protein NMG60_11023120 [Bertholletia excelsa]
MASPVPAKSQPLHNFKLPLLKWSNNTSNHHRSRRLADSSPPRADSALRQSPVMDSAARRTSPLLDTSWRQSPMRDSASESESGHASENRKTSTPESVKNGLTVSSPDHVIEKSEKKSASSDADGSGVKDVRSKIYIRFRTKTKPDDVQDEGKAGTEGEAEESVAKTWNLRPRKPIRKLSNSNGGVPKIGGAPSPVNKSQLQQAAPNRSESGFLRSGHETELAEKKQKRQRFSVALSRQEIEEDIYALTGSKPARRPKKRAKAVQKQLDTLFPGLWLAAITPDSYKVYEPPLKG